MSKAIPLEATISGNIREMLKRRGVWFRKNSPGSRGYVTGTHDFHVLEYGAFFSIEVKRPAKSHRFDWTFETVCEHCLKECTEPQLNEIENVRAQKGTAHVVTCAAEAECLLNYKLG